MHLQGAEVEEHHRIEVADRLIAELHHPIAEAQEAVRDRLEQRATNQQLQIGTSLLPPNRRTRQRRQEAQAIAATTDAQLEALRCHIKRHLTAKSNGLRSVPPAEHPVDCQAVVLELQLSPFQG